MKKHLLKTLLMGVMTLIATGAWAADPDLTNDYTLVKSVEWGDGTNIAGSGACAHTAYDTGNKKQQSLTILTAPEAAAGWIALQAWTDGSGKGWWNRADKGLYCKSAGRSACVFGDDLTTGWLVVFECTQTAGNVMTLTNDKGEPDGTFSYVASEDGKSYFCTITAATDAYVGFCGNKDAIGISKISVYKPNKAVVATTYTVNYVDMDGNTLKDPATYNAIGGADIALSDADKANIVVGDDTYVYDSDDTEGKTVAEDGSSVVTVKFHKAQNFNYTVNEMCGGTAVRVTKSFSYETATVIAPYRKYNAVDGQLYTKGDTSKEYNYRFTLKQDNQVENIDYEAVSGVDNVVFLTEGEDIEGLTPCNSANTGIRSSNSASAFAAADTKIVTLGPGTYKMHAIIYDASKEPNSHWIFKAGETQIADFNCTTVNIQEFDSEEFTLTENADIIMAAAGGNTMGLDALYITGTGEVVPDTYTVAGTLDLTGYDWDNSKNIMTFDESTGLYSWVATDITVTAEQKPEFKIVKNSDWSTCWPENNWVITPEVLEGEGVYTITITFNADTKEIGVTGEKTAEMNVDITVDVAEGDIAAALAAAKEGIEKVGDITINLVKGVTYTVSASLEAPAGITINGNDAIIDASALEAPFIAMANVEEPTKWTEANVRIAGIKMTGLKKALFYSTCKNYIAKDFTVDWVNVEVAANTTLFDFTKGSTAVNFNVTNSTFYAPEATGNAFYSSQAGQKVTDAGDYTQTFKFHNNTMYNLAKSKNFFSHRQSNQTWLTYDVQNNIFVNCGKSGQVIKGMNGGQDGKNPTWIIIGNAFNFDDADTSAAEATGDTDHTGDETPGLNETVQNSLAGVITFADAANGDFNGEFTLGEDATAPEAAIGAPAWTITFKEYVAPITDLVIVGDFTGGFPVQDAETGAWDWSMAKAMTQDTENPAIWTLTVEGFEAEAKTYEYKAATGSWEGYQLPAEGNQNWVFAEGSDYPAGKYDLIFTVNTEENTLTLEPRGEDAPELTAPEGWTSGITNGNLAGTDVASYIAKAYPSTDIVAATIVAGAGKSGSHGILIKTADDADLVDEAGELVKDDQGNNVHKAEAWDSQFWIKLNEAVPAGTKVHVEFDYKASQAAKATTQSHGNPGAYQHWAAIGDVNFTTEWQHFSKDIEVDDAMAKGDNGNGNGTGLLTIAFNLQEEKSATDYHFDNFGVWYQKPVEIKSMAIVGDFLGLEGDANWDLANGWEMSQSAENIWTLTKKFTAEAKKYEYKAYANGETTGYQLPAEGNQDFVFGTDEYPAGEYNLSFTANTKENKLTLAVEKYIPEGEEAEEKVAPEGWTNAITNGNLAGEDATSYFMKEYPSTDIVPAAIVAGAGKNGSRGILVKTADDADLVDEAGELVKDDQGNNVHKAEAWDSQFWIKLNEAVPAGTKVHVEFDYMASQAAKATTQAHGEPGAYQHWAAIGDVNFTTEWQHFSTDIEVNDAMAKGGDGNGNGTGLLTIAFNLQEEKSATDYHFDNFGVWYQKPVVINSMAIVGDFLGLEGDANWDLANGWAMEQDAENPAIWTLKKEKFTAEAKKYEYKAVANGVWGEYELPEKGNQNYVFTVAGDYDLTFTADTKNHNVSLYAELITNEGEEAPELVAPKGWVSLVTNGNLAGDNADSYVMKEYPSTDIVPAAIEAGAGKNGSRGIIVRAGDDTNHLNDKGEDASQAWDSQFWIVLSEALPSGTKLHVEFDYMASKVAKATTQAHGNPGAYQHWAAIGDVNFTEEWQHFSTEIVVDDAMAKGDNGNGNGTGLLTIAFNLQEERSAVDYHFDNFGVWYEKPVVINSMAIVGDFLGLATEENPNADWDPANGWQMEQDAENPAIWTLTKPFTAEAKTYQYKATANGTWGDYELPAEGNYNFEFGTAEYPAGDYKLVFTADTENNTLDLVVKPATVLTFTATFTTNAYWWDDVYAYAWSGEGENVNEYLGAWPGTKLKANSDGVYTVSVEGEVAPEMIVFSNGNTGEGNQTEDLAFEDGKAYEFVFAPTFDFENNNGQWAEKATFESGSTMDDITLTGNSKVNYASGQLRVNASGSITLTAPEGKSIVKIEFEALKSDKFGLAPSKGEVAKTKEVVLSVDSEGNKTFDYSIWTWTGNGKEVSFEHDKSVKQPKLGFINVTLADYVPDNGYYLVGNMNDWKPSEDYMLELNSEAGEGVEEYMISLDLEADAQFKVVKIDGETETWFPGDGKPNYGENGELTAGANKYNVYFRPFADGGEDWFYGVLYVVDTVTDGINGVSIDTKNAVIYNLSGQKVQKTHKGLYIVNGKKLVLK